MRVRGPVPALRLSALAALLSGVGACSAGALAPVLASTDANATKLETVSTLGVNRVADLERLLEARRAGAPFAPQEVEVLDAFDAGLPITSLEADIVLSRALYEVTIAGRPATATDRALLAAYRAHWITDAREVLARNAQLNADANTPAFAIPDGSREWQVYSDPVLFNQLSSAAQRRLEGRFGYRGRARVGRGILAPWSSVPASVESAPPNTLVNNIGLDVTVHDTQSGTALVLGSGNTVLCSFNDSGSIDAGSHFTGIARSANGGASWLDQGTLPDDANGDGGDPVLARNNVSGTIVLATLGYQNLASLPTFRSLNDGVSYLSQVDGGGGGGFDDKEWLTCDNTPGAGQGTFYLIYRDFGMPGGMSLTRSFDNGATWSGRVLPSANTGNVGWVVVGADHAVYCFWLETGNQIVFRKSINQGLSFGAPTVVTTLNTPGVNGALGLSGGFRTNACIQVVAHPTDPNQLYMVWNDKEPDPSPDKANVYFSQTSNGGASWSSPVQVNTDAGNDNWQPVLAR